MKTEIIYKERKIFGNSRIEKEKINLKQKRTSSNGRGENEQKHKEKLSTIENLQTIKKARQTKNI